MMSQYLNQATVGQILEFEPIIIKALTTASELSNNWDKYLYLHPNVYMNIVYTLDLDLNNVYNYHLCDTKVDLKTKPWRLNILASSFV